MFLIQVRLLCVYNAADVIWGTELRKSILTFWTLMDSNIERIMREITKELMKKMEVMNSSAW